MNLLDDILCPPIWRGQAEKNIKNNVLNYGSKNVLFYLVKNDSVFTERLLPIHNVMCRDGFDSGINFARGVLKHNNATAMILGMPTLIVDTQDNKKVERSRGYVIHYENGVSVSTKIYKVVTEVVSLGKRMLAITGIKCSVKKYKLELFKEEFNVCQPFSHVISKFIPISLN